MWLDIIIVAIMLIAIIRGKVSGFMETVIRFLSLIGALVLGVMFTKPVSEFLYTTRLDENLIERLNEVAEDGVIDLSYYIPRVLSNTFGALEELSLRMTVLHFTNVTITMLSFMLIVILVWLVATILIRGLRKSKKEKGVIGSVDSSVGLLLGTIKGILLVFLFLAFMFPVTGIFMPEKVTMLNSMLNDSIIAGRLYDLNPLLIFMRSLSL